MAATASRKGEAMNAERCKCGRAKGHESPTYKAPSFVVEYADGRKVQTSVAARWGSHAARAHGMPEVSPRIAKIGAQNEPAEQDAGEVAAAKEEPKRRKAPAKRAAKAPNTPEEQGDLF